MLAKVLLRFDQKFSLAIKIQVGNKKGMECLLGKRVAYPPSKVRLG